MDSAFTGILHYFVSIHNLTFDMVESIQSQVNTKNRMSMYSYDYASQGSSKAWAYSS